jgi:hypothetical protein
MTTLTVTAQVTKRCPYKNERDDGTATLTFWVGNGDGPELHDLAHTLGSFRDEAISHEDFTRRLLGRPGCREVVTRWTTAGMTVECRAAM